MTRTPADATPPPDLYGRPRPDRLMRALTRIADGYLALRSARPPRAVPPTPSPVPSGPGGPGDGAWRPLVVRARRDEADGVVSLTLAAPDGGPLPRWQPGAHLDLRLPSGRRRSYSLCGDPADRDGYRIAVRRIPPAPDGPGGGGSAEAHDTLRPGARVAVSTPRNAFPFAAEPAVLFLAGGIGITPLLPMAREAARRGLDWRLTHCGRDAASLPFGAELRALDPDGERVEIRPDDEHGLPGPAALLARATPGAAVYACGPAPMLDGVRAALDASPAAGLHVERFAPAPVPGGRPFRLRLGAGGPELPVPADRSALDVLREARPEVPYSCRQGFCGVCRQRVLPGSAAVEHRDRRLTPAERAAGEVLVCVSRGAAGECVVLDL
jgi:ferredoxin-NADP reductase